LPLLLLFSNKGLTLLNLGLSLTPCQKEPQKSWKSSSSMFFSTGIFTPKNRCDSAYIFLFLLSLRSTTFWERETATSPNNHKEDHHLKGKKTVSQQSTGFFLVSHFMYDQDEADKAKADVEFHIAPPHDSAQLA